MSMSARAPPIHASSSAASIAATCKAHALTPEQFAALRDSASAAKSSAYCPYSKFRVGAALLGHDDSITTGANVENASYPVGTCAERVALGKAVTERGLRAFKAVAVATDVAPPASPCGMCRQFIREFCRLDMPVIMFDRDENFVVLTLEEDLWFNSVFLRICVPFVVPGPPGRLHQVGSFESGCGCGHIKSMAQTDDTHVSGQQAITRL